MLLHSLVPSLRRLAKRWLRPDRASHWDILRMEALLTSALTSRRIPFGVLPPREPRLTDRLFYPLAGLPGLRTLSAFLFLLASRCIALDRFFFGPASLQIPARLCHSRLGARLLASHFAALLSAPPAVCGSLAQGTGRTRLATLAGPYLGRRLLQGGGLV